MTRLPATRELRQSVPAPARPRWSGRVLRVAAGAAVVLGVAGLADGQARNPLFERTTNPSVVSQQVQLALPSALRGLELLTARGSDPVSLEQAVSSIDDTYKYLRAAQESSELINNRAKYPDPTRQVQMTRMWGVRLELLECLKQRGHIVQQSPEAISTCTEHLTEGIRRLRVLLAIMP